MIRSRILVVGGGPAGSACAGALKRAGLETMILDQKQFPRPKTCAGWVSPKVFKALELNPKTYPHTLKQFKRIHFHLFGMRLPVKTCQYAIRRYEFDQWMLLGAHVPVHTHKVRHIKQHRGYYIIDDKYQCKYLVGAGGTLCPVYRTFFKKTDPRPAKAMITAVEKEYQCDFQDNRCHIWYFENNLPGYAWYLPKGNGWLNIGIGGKLIKVKKQNMTIMDHWHLFTKKLVKNSLIKQAPPYPKGHNYFLCHKRNTWCRDRVFIIGDAAGLSTLDMGEGIHGAIKSGLMAADTIVNHGKFIYHGQAKFSLPGIFLGKNHKD
jgi:flavin-dependent dehydrogenase